MKRIPKSVASIVALLVLAACGAAPQQPTGQASTTSAQQDQTPASQAASTAGATDRTLRIMGSARTYPGEETAWADVVTAFEAICACKVETQFEGEWSEIPQRLQTARMANEPVDVITCGANQVNSILARSGALMDLTELITPFQDRFETGMLDPYTIGGRTWAMPFSSVSTSVVYYNKTLFDELGLAEPQTYDELAAAATKIRDQKAMMPMIHQGKSTFMWPMWFFETFAQTSGNKSVELTDQFLKGSRSFNSPEEVAAFDQIARFAKDGVLAPESADTDGEGMRAAFAQQKAAMFYGGTWEVANVRAAVKDFDVGVFPFPRVTDQPSVKSQHGGGPDSCLAIPSTIAPADLDLAVQFLEFVTRPDNANILLGVTSPFFASVKGVKAVDDALTSDLDAKAYPDTIRFLDWIWPAEVNDAVMNGISGVVAGTTTAEQAAQSVQDAYDNMVAEKQYSYDWWTTWSDADWAKVKPPSIPAVEVGK